MKEQMSAMNVQRELSAKGPAATHITSQVVPENAAGDGFESDVLQLIASSWDGTTYQAYPSGLPELAVRRICTPAHSISNWHSHPMPNVAYVVKGEITIEGRDGQSHHFTAGQVIAESVNVVHRGIIGDQPAEFIVFYAGVKDMPLSQQKK